MGVGAGLYMYVVVVQKFTFAISSPDEFLSYVIAVIYCTPHAECDTDRHTTGTVESSLVNASFALCYLHYANFIWMNFEVVYCESLFSVGLSHSRTVVRQCYKGDDQSQRRRANFDARHP